MILVCFAVSQEARPFRTAQPSGVRILVTGMGKNACSQKVLPVLDEHPRFVLTCGFCGGLNPGLKQGDILFEADPDFPRLESLVAAGAKSGSFLCAEQVVVTAKEKAELRRSTAADAVEMESGHIRKWCAAAGIPSATVRVVLDEAGADLPVDFNRLSGKDQQLHAGKLARAILQKPALVPALMRLGRESDRAARALANVLRQVTAGG